MRGKGIDSCVRGLGFGVLVGLLITIISKLSQIAGYLAILVPQG